MVINYAQGNTTIWDNDVNALMNASAGFGILSGCSISKGTGDWDIDVTSGTIFITGTGEVSVSSGTVTITDSSGLSSGESRITLITADVTGTLAFVDGTAASNIDSPDIPTDEVLLGFVVVADTDGTVADSDINDVPALTHLQGTTFIESQSPAGVATADFTSSFGSHEAHVFVLQNVIPATDPQVFFLRTSTDAGANWDSGASDYAYANRDVDSSGTTATDSSTGDSEIELSISSIGGAAGESGVSGVVQVLGAGLAKRTHVVSELGYVDSSGALTSFSGAGKRNAAEDVTGVRFLFSSGNIESGTIKHIGVN